MASKTYMAVIRHDGTPKTLTILAAGTQAHCAGAVEAWRSFSASSMTDSGLTATAPATDTPLIVVEVAE